MSYTVFGGELLSTVYKDLPVQYWASFLSFSTMFSSAITQKSV